MVCKSCQSKKVRSFNGELAIHFPGREGLDKPAVLVFPNLLVCLHCGFTEFTVTENQLHRLEEDTAA